MIEVRNYSKIEDDTEVIAIMPSVDSAVDWIRAQLDLELYLEGDYYCIDEYGIRTYLTCEGKGRVSVSFEESHLLTQLIALAADERPGTGSIARCLQDRFGWGVIKK